MNKIQRIFQVFRRVVILSVKMFSDRNYLSILCFKFSFNSSHRNVPHCQSCPRKRKRRNLSTLFDSTNYGPSMPTANEVDNRPVAVGKWPRHHQHSSGYDRYSRQPGCGRRKCGSGDNCVHKYGNNCVDVLLRPELLHEIYGERGNCIFFQSIFFCVSFFAFFSFQPIHNQLWPSTVSFNIWKEFWIKWVGKLNVICSRNSNPRPSFGLTATIRKLQMVLLLSITAY